MTAVRPDQRAIVLDRPGGALTLSARVLTTLVAREVLETPGVVRTGGLISGVIGRLLDRLLGWLPARLGGVGFLPGVRVDLGEGEVGVAVRLVARSGVDLPELADALRARVGRRVQGLTGLEVRCVDVTVVGLTVDRARGRRTRREAARAAREHFSFPTSFPAG